MYFWVPFFTTSRGEMELGAFACIVYEVPSLFFFFFFSPTLSVYSSIAHFPPSSNLRQWHTLHESCDSRFLTATSTVEFIRAPLINSSRQSREIVGVQNSGKRPRERERKIKKEMKKKKKTIAGPARAMTQPSEAPAGPIAWCKNKNVQLVQSSVCVCVYARPVVV
jgi:hypothetical protein